MNFFEQQDQARSSTARLILLFSVAIVTLILITSFPAAWLFATIDVQAQGNDATATTLRFDVFAGVAAVILCVVVLGALYRIAQLRSGGSAIAASMGGILLTRNQAADDELKILNVVEEMAIASGLPVPPVYLINDDAINAFAAGYRQQDAVIGITRGAIRLLDRDELQGVIAHEFSHVFNGDMRLNLRLVGWLHGLLLIGLLGRVLLRIPRSVNRQRSQFGGGVVALGFLFTVLGYTGVLFGNLIKSAVSRQREFLADASAVQFTRNPEGIGNALKKIGGFPLGSRLLMNEVTEISHMLFGDGVMKRSFSWFATHPPLADRIRRIDPNWDGLLINPEKLRERSWSSLPPEAQSTPQPLRPEEVLASTVVASIGNATAANITEASAQLDALPTEMRQQLDTTLEAALMMYAIVIADAGADTARKQLVLLQQLLSPPSFRLLMQQLRLARLQSRALDQTVVDLAQPALKQLSPAQLDDFLRVLEKLVAVDAVLTLHEWSLGALLRHHLGISQIIEKQRRELAACTGECRLLLAALAQAGQQDAVAAAQAFAAAWTLLGLLPVDYLVVSDFRQLDSAVCTLRALKPLQKPALLKAMVSCMHHDGTVKDTESMLLRTVAALLDCPLPPWAR